MSYIFLISILNHHNSNTYKHLSTVFSYFKIICSKSNSLWCVLNHSFINQSLSLIFSFSLSLVSFHTKGMHISHKLKKHSSLQDNHLTSSCIKQHFWPKFSKLPLVPNMTKSAGSQSFAICTPCLEFLQKPLEFDNLWNLTGSKVKWWSLNQ